MSRAFPNSRPEQLTIPTPPLTTGERQQGIVRSLAAPGASGYYRHEALHAPGAPLPTEMGSHPGFSLTITSSLQWHEEGSLFSNTALIVAFDASRPAEEAGYVTARLHDLRLYRNAAEFVQEMKTLPAPATGYAGAVCNFGPEFWRARDMLLAIEFVQVRPQYRQRGLGRALARACVRAAARGKRDMDVVLQPFPLEITLTPAGFGRRPVSEREFDARFQRNVAFWRRTLPFLSLQSPGIGPGGETFAAGRAPLALASTPASLAA